MSQIYPSLNNYMGIPIKMVDTIWSSPAFNYDWYQCCLDNIHPDIDDESFEQVADTTYRSAMELMKEQQKIMDAMIKVPRMTIKDISDYRYI